MGIRTIVPILGEHFPSQSKVQSVQELVNFYLEEDTTQQRFIAYGTPGFSEWVNLTGSEVRGMLEHKGKGYVVVDNTVYEITDSSTISSIGTLTTSTGLVQMAAINDEIGIVDGATYTHYKISTTTFSTPGDVDIPSSPQSITSISEYFIIPEPDDKKFFVSDLADGTSWRALSFASADTQPDNIVTMKSVNSLVMAFCSRSVEIFYVSGGANIPLDRAVSGSYEFGCLAKDSPVVIDNVMYWLANNKNGEVGVVRSNGGQPELISNRPMVQAVGQYDTTSDAFGWSYQENGHPFYLVTFPSAETLDGQAIGKTWGYDLSTKAWSLWSSKRVNAIQPPRESRHVANCHMYLGNEHLIGDYLSGKIYKMADTINTEDGEEIKRKIITQHLVSNGLSLTMDNLVVETENGVGLASGQGSDPQIMLRHSKDRGRTWSDELWRSSGQLGEYQARAIWNRLGSGRSITLELTFSDPINWVILGATALMDVETNG